MKSLYIPDAAPASMWTFTRTSPEVGVGSATSRTEPWSSSRSFTNARIRSPPLKNRWWCNESLGSQGHDQIASDRDEDGDGEQHAVPDSVAPLITREVERDRKRHEQRET